MVDSITAHGTSRGRVNPHTLTQPVLTRARSLAAVLHAADHATHLANIAVAAFTAIAGGTSRSSTGRGCRCPRGSEWFIGDTQGNGEERGSIFRLPSTGPLEGDSNHEI